MICLEGDGPPIDAVMILAKRRFAVSFLPLDIFFGLVLWHRAQINGPLMQQRMKNFKRFFRETASKAKS